MYILFAWWESLIASRPHRQAGSVTVENVIWALAVILIAGIVVGAITAYVTSHSNELLAGG